MAEFEVKLDEVESVGSCSQANPFACRVVLAWCAEQAGPVAGVWIELPYRAPGGTRWPLLCSQLVPRIHRETSCLSGLQHAETVGRQRPQNYRLCVELNQLVAERPL